MVFILRFHFLHPLLINHTGLQINLYLQLFIMLSIQKKVSTLKRGQVYS